MGVTKEDIMKDLLVRHDYIRRKGLKSYLLEVETCKKKYNRGFIFNNTVFNPCFILYFALPFFELFSLNAIKCII